MALSECNTATDALGRELLEHGTVTFPIACYHDDLQKSSVPWHWHEELEAVVITEGSAVIAAGNDKYILGPGEGFFINAGILHACWPAGAGDCRFHSLVFHPRLVGGSLDSVFYQNYIHPLITCQSLESTALRPDMSWQHSVLDAIETAWQACLREEAGFEFRTRSALSELVFLLCSQIPVLRHRPSSKSLRDAERIKTMLQFIHQNHSGPLSTAAIAASAMISESECLRCFRSTIATTPIRYVKEYRLVRAAQMLCSTGDLIADISDRCGFQDVSYFTKAFRERYGCPPAQYRSQTKKPT